MKDVTAHDQDPQASPVDELLTAWMAKCSSTSDEILAEDQLNAWYKEARDAVSFFIDETDAIYRSLANAEYDVTSMVGTHHPIYRSWEEASTAAKNARTYAEELQLQFYDAYQKLENQEQALAQVLQAFVEHATTVGRTHQFTQFSMLERSDEASDALQALDNQVWPDLTVPAQMAADKIRATDEALRYYNQMVAGSNATVKVELPGGNGLTKKMESPAGIDPDHRKELFTNMMATIAEEMQPLLHRLGLL